MPVNEENKELRDLVAETLKAKGVLGKVQAEIRASVFLALEEQDVFKDKSPFLNQPLNDFVKTSNGLKVLSLVREFLEFFNLEFTTMVFDPETHAGINYNYEGRSKLATDLAVDSPSADLPLLAHVLSSSTNAPANDSTGGDSNCDRQGGTKDQNRCGSPEIAFSNGLSGDETHDKVDGEKRNLSNGDPVRSTETNRDKPKPKDNNSLTSLSNLPPLNNRTQSFNKKGSDLKSLIDIGLNSTFDKTTGSNKLSKSGNGDSDSGESEIEEDIASHNSNMSGVTAVSVVAATKKDTYNVTSEGSMNKAAVCDTLEQLKALSLSFVKDLKLGNSRQSSQTSSAKSTISTSRSGSDLDSKCDTISEIEDLFESDGDITLMQNSEVPAAPTVYASDRWKLKK